MAGIITTISPIKSPKKLKNTQSNNSNIESPVLGLREDFESTINNLVDTALLALKRKVLDVKKSLSSLSQSPSNTTDPHLESYKSQISSDSHVVYDYSQEFDLSVMKHLTFQLYKLLLHPTEKSDSIFMQARRSTEQELRLKEQECIVLKKQISYLENCVKQAGNQSSSELEGISTKVLELEHKLMSSSLKVLKQKKSELQAVNLTNALRASNGYSSDLKQLNDALQKEIDLLKEKHQKVLQQAAIGEQQLKDVKQANIELDIALKYQILHTNQLKDQLLHLEYNNSNLQNHSQSILGMLPNSKENKSSVQSNNSMQRATQISSNIISRDRSPDKNIRVPVEFFQETTAASSENNYKFDYIKLSEFTLSLIAQLLESGPTIQLQPLRHHLETKRKDIQLKYIEATTLPKTNNGSHKKPIFQQQINNKQQ